jgi:NAD(P)-dependent dehydrogenase (short-subunit alcohol dehydrogenase family)
MSPTRILITGGGRGIGRAIALRFAQPGVKICVAARTSAELDKVVEEIEAKGGEAIAAQCNLRDHGSIEAAVFRAVDFFDGEMDLLVNNAGIFDVKPLEECDPDFIQRHFEVNLIGAMQVTQEALAALREASNARVVMINSTAGQQGYPGSTVYCATKYGMRGFADALRLELQDDGVQVTTIYPDSTDTTIFDGVNLELDRSAMDRPEDVAEVVWRCATGAETRTDVPVRR